MYADYCEQYKDKVNYLDRESSEHRYLIASLLNRMAILEEIVQQYEEVSPRNESRGTIPEFILKEEETTSKNRLRSSLLSIIVVAEIELDIQKVLLSHLPTKF
jgi:hypothetical protein